MSETTDLMQPPYELLPCPFCGNELEVSTRKLNKSARCRAEECKGAQLPLLNLDIPRDVIAWNTRTVPKGWMLVPVEPTAERMAAAALSVLAPATGDMELARQAAKIVIWSDEAPRGLTINMLAAHIVTMAPAYRAMITAQPQRGEN